MRSFLAAAILATAMLVNAAEPPRRPNIVIIVADDLGWNAVGYHGGFARTPNIDRIAHEGVELDRFYVCPMCSPTRAGLLTGRYAIHMGMGRAVVRPWAHYGLPTDARTLPTALADAGYKDRVAFGKWHLGHLDPKWHPLAKGFTHFIGCYNGALDYFTRERDGQIDWHNDYQDINPKGYTTDLIAADAVKFISSHKKATDPYFCYVAFTAVHDPPEAPDDYIKRYPNFPGRKGIVAAQDECMDDGIGRILKAIEDSGAKDNTLVWFLSDNGGIDVIPENNAPLRGHKLTAYEGGIRAPAAVWWPGVIEGGRKCATPVVHVDLMPTLLKLCGAQTTGGKPLDGIDVWPILRGESNAPARDVYGFEGQQGLNNEQIAVITPDSWKLIVTGPDVRRSEGADPKTHRLELFDLQHDPYEKNDLSNAQPQRVKQLADRIVAFRKTEPDNALPAINRPPPNFAPPKNWHNAPAGK